MTEFHQSSTRLRLPPSVAVHVKSGRLYVAADAVYHVARVSPAITQAFEGLSGPNGTTVARLESLLGVVMARRLHERMRELKLVQELPENYVAPAGLRGTAAYLDTALHRPVAMDELAALRLLIIGCGGIGVEFARHAVASGVRDLVLVDHDVVHVDNLNRQYLYRPEDFGQPKVVVAKRRLESLEPAVSVRSCETAIETVADLRSLRLGRLDAVLSCADHPSKWSCDQTALQFARESGAVFATGSVGVRTGSWGPILRPDALAIRSASWASSDYATVAEPTPVSLGPTNSLVAAALARDVMHVLLGDDAPSLNTRLTIHFGTYAVRADRVTA